MKTNIRFFIIVLVFLCIGRLPKANAVVPPPDGGYPGLNTAEGLQKVSAQLELNQPAPRTVLNSR